MVHISYSRIYELENDFDWCPDNFVMMVIKLIIKYQAQFVHISLHLIFPAYFKLLLAA